MGLARGREGGKEGRREGAPTAWEPDGTHFVGQQEALDGSADDLHVCFSPNFKSVFAGGQELGAHFLQQEAVLG